MIYRYEDDAPPMIVPFEQAREVEIKNVFMINFSKLLKKKNRLCLPKLHSNCTEISIILHIINKIKTVFALY